MCLIPEKTHMNKNSIPNATFRILILSCRGGEIIHKSNIIFTNHLSSTAI